MDGSHSFKYLLISVIAVVFIFSAAYVLAGPIVTLNTPINNFNTTNSTPAFNFNASGNFSAYNCTLYIDSLPHGTSEISNDTATSIVTNATLTNATHSWNVTCTDSDGVSNSTKRTLIVDQLAPVTTATANISSGAGYTFGTFTNSAYVNVTLLCADTLTACDKTLYCTNSSNACVPNQTYSVPVQISTQDISYIRYGSNDTLGNLETSGSGAIIIDTVSPSLTVNSPVLGAYLNSRALTINVTSTDSFLNYTKVSVYNSTGSLANTTNSTTNGNFAATLGVSMDGVYTINVTAYDNATNTNISNVVNITVDTVYPVISFNVSTETDGSTLNRSDIMINVTGSDTHFSNISINLYNSSGALVTSNTTTSTSGFIDFTVSFDGTYYFNATIFDRSGNSNSTSTRSVIVDTTAPVITVVSPIGALAYATKSLGLDITTDENATCMYDTNDSAYSVMANSFSDNGTIHTAEGYTVSAGHSYTIYTRCMDSYGNIDSTSTDISFSVNSQPAAVYSGGGGGGSSASYEYSSSSSYADMPQGNNIVTVSNTNIPLEQLTVGLTNTESNVRFTVTVKYSPSATYSSGMVYKYIQVDHTGIDDTHVSGAKIDFKVDKGWLTTNNLDKGVISLVRYSGTQWTVLKTKIVSEDSTYVHYEADSPGLSLYAIAPSTPASTPVSTPSDTVASTTANTATSTPVTTSPGTDTNTNANTADNTASNNQNAGVQQSPLVWPWILALVIVFIAVIVYMFTKGKRK